jgi:hypothetical protein
MFVPVDQEHVMRRSDQRDGQLARCTCGGVLAIDPDSIEFANKDTRKADGRVLSREQARAIALQLAETSGPVHRHIENKDDGKTAIILGNTKIKVS